MPECQNTVRTVCDLIYPPPLQSQHRTYIVYMPSKYAEYDNVYDFTEYKLYYLIEELDDVGNEAMAEVYQDVLDNYMLGNIDIKWVEGQPFIVKGRINKLNDNEQLV